MKIECNEKKVLYNDQATTINNCSKTLILFMKNNNAIIKAIIEGNYTFSIHDTLNPDVKFDNDLGILTVTINQNENPPPPPKENTVTQESTG